MFEALGMLGHAMAAIGFAALALGHWRQKERDGESRDRRIALVVAFALTAFASLAAAIEGPLNAVALFAAALRNLAWLHAIYRLSGGLQRPGEERAELAIYAVLACIGAALPAFDLAPQLIAMPAAAVALVGGTAALLHMMLAVGALFLVHNLYLRLPPGARGTLALPLAALALMWGFDLNAFTVAYLAGERVAELEALRGPVMLAMAALMAMAGRERYMQRFRPSRFVALQSLSLVAAAAYLAAMLLLAQLMALVGGNYARLAQASFLLGMGVAALFVLPSRWLRSWINVKVAKHLFRHRYDYRAEWMRFNETMGDSAEGQDSFEARVGRAIADAADCEAAVVLTMDADGRHNLAAHWRWPTAMVPAEPLSAALAGWLAASGHIVDLDAVRRGDAPEGAPGFPDWLLAEPRAWVLAPMVHFGRLAGVAVLARPLVARALDWEDLDLLRVVSRQLASYLAERAGQAALLESQRFDEFNRRFAFVLHDVKNLASQLSLLARNAEKHSENPAFRADMVVTLRHSVDKLDTLLSRLSRYGGGGSGDMQPVDLGALCRQVAGTMARAHPVEVTGEPVLAVTADPARLEQVLVHLIQNAIDASRPGTPVLVNVHGDSGTGQVDIIDAGCGMSPDFLRGSLFRPFTSTKPGGFGIGAFEARELLRAMGGRIDVTSTEGVGSRFSLRLPRADRPGAAGNQTMGEAA